MQRTRWGREIMKHTLVAILVILVLLLPACTKTYILSTSVSPSGSGSISLNPSGGVYDEGTSVTLTAQAASGYVFDHWNGDASDTSPTKTITMNSDKSVTAYFRAITTSYHLSTSVSPSGSGSVSPGSGTYEAGSTVYLTAHPASGYEFDHWGGDASGTSPTTPITMNSDKSVTAYFKYSPPPSIPLNVRIDYIGVKDAKGGDDYGEDPYKGEIQLVIVITDGSNETHRYYIPQEGPNGLQGFKEGIENYSVKQINRPLYHTASAGDYLGLSIMAYDRDSNEKLLTDAAIAEEMAKISGVPEAEIAATIMRILVSMLPPNEDELVGEYEETWKPAQYAIGHYVANCLDEAANQNFFVWFSIWSDKEPPLPERPSLPGVPEVQTLECTMPSNIVTGSYARYEKSLQAGEKVNGSLRLTGTYVSGLAEWDNTCSFWVYDPDGNEINEWDGEFKEGGLYHEFNFTASLDGEYTIKVGHASVKPRELHIEISPFGWH